MYALSFKTPNQGYRLICVYLQEMRQTVQTFSTALLDHVRTSAELDVILNYNPDPNTVPWEPGDRQSLERLKLAIKYKLKSVSRGRHEPDSRTVRLSNPLLSFQFVAHPNVQQLLAAIWYRGLPGFRRKTMFEQIIEVFRIGSSFFMYSTAFLMAPESEMGSFLKFPFVKFVCHSASYGAFLGTMIPVQITLCVALGNAINKKPRISAGLLAMASQRVEKLTLEILGHLGHEYLLEIVNTWNRKERGSMFGMVESMIVLFVFSRLPLISYFRPPSLLGTILI